MTKYIGVMIVWIVVAGFVLYVFQHIGDLSAGASSVTKGGDLKALFESINSIFQ